MPKNSLIFSSISVAIALLIGYVFSFAKEAILAGYFGVSMEMDAYAMAIQVPVNLFAFVSVAIHSVVVPLYSSILSKEGKVVANDFAVNLVNILIVISILFIFIGEIFAEYIMYLFAPGFNEITHALSVKLLRVTFPTVLFSVVINVFVAILNSNRVLFAPSLGTCLLNLGIIFSVVICANKFGIIVACFGQLIGLLLQFLYVRFLVRKFFHYKLVMNLKDCYIRKAGKMTLPVIWNISSAEILAITNRIVASFMVVGALSALSYASKLNTIFVTFILNAVSTVIYPLYARVAAKEDFTSLTLILNKTMSYYALFVVPVMCMLFLYKKEIIELAFARGVFGKEAVNSVQMLFGYYTIGLLFIALRETITKFFYALQDTKTPARNATIGVFVNIVLSVVLPIWLGVRGLAISSTLAKILVFVLLAQKMKALIVRQGSNLLFFQRNITKILLASALMFLCLCFFKMFVEIENVWLSFFVGGGIGVIVYMIVLYVLRVNIFIELFLRIRLWKK